MGLNYKKEIMTKMNKFEEKFPPEEEIIPRIKEIVQELQSNFENGNTLEGSSNEKHFAVAKFYKQVNSKRNILEFAKKLNIEPAINGSDFSGIYVFAEKEESGELKFMYTGISRTVIERVNSHVNRRDSGTATWAYQMAKYNYEKDKNAKIPKNEIQHKISDIQEEEISKYYVSFIHEPDNYIMHIAEGFVACTLECEWNSFKTH